MRQGLIPRSPRGTTDLADPGATLPVGEKRVPLEIAPGDDDEHFRYVVRMPLTRGHAWDIAVALHDELGGETSVVTARVELPAR